MYKTLNCLIFHFLCDDLLFRNEFIITAQEASHVLEVFPFFFLFYIVINLDCSVITHTTEFLP